MKKINQKYRFKTKAEFLRFIKHNLLLIEKKEFHKVDSTFLLIFFYIFSVLYLTAGYKMYAMGKAYIFDPTTLVFIILVGLYTRPHLFIRNLKLTFKFSYVKNTKERVQRFFAPLTNSSKEEIYMFILLIIDRVHMGFFFLSTRALSAYMERPYFYTIAYTYCPLYWWTDIIPILFPPLPGFGPK
jgi:hypothetical protein